MKNRRRAERGGSALETALFLPMYVFFFIGAYDWGFYAHALIAAETAARTAVLYTSYNSANAGDCIGAAKLANEELRAVPNAAASPLSGCGSSVLSVAAAAVGPGQATESADKNPASQISVQYTTMSLIPIPGLLGSSATICRRVQMPIRN